jgi:hypothetical protein
MTGMDALPVIGQCLYDAALIDATMAAPFNHRL